MKITLNLSPPASARDRYALAWAGPITLIGVVVLVLMGGASLREYRAYRDTQRQVGEVQKRAAALGLREADIRRKLDDPAYRALLHRAEFVNGLIDQKSLSFTELSARLAGLLPPDACLTGLALSSSKKQEQDYMVRIGISARNEDAVETFINDLEDAPDFKEVSIINQGFQEQSSQGQQINLICTARYVPGADIETGKTSEEESTPNRKSNR